MSSLTMFAKFFRLCKGESASVSASVSASSMLRQAFEKLENKEIILQEKIALEIARAKEFTKAKNRPAALQCLMRKKFYEGQIEHLGNFQMLIHDKEQKLQKKSSVNCGQRQQITSNGNGNFGKNAIHTPLHSALYMRQKKGF